MSKLQSKILNDKGVKLYSDKGNIGRRIVDSEGNEFVIDECHSGFVWLRNTRGVKQISNDQLKYYREIKSRKRSRNRDKYSDFMSVNKKTEGW